MPDERPPDRKVLPEWLMGKIYFIVFRHLDYPPSFSISGFTQITQPFGVTIIAWQRGRNKLEG